METILQQLETGVQEIVDTRLSIMKPLMAQWMMHLYDYMLSKPNIIISGFRAA